jgi:hypothetical protein
MSAILMMCSRCGGRFIAGVIGITPWPAHVCPDGAKGALAVHVRTDEFFAASPAPPRTEVGE